MDDLIKMVADKAGISPEQAKSAVDAIMEFMKDKLPPGAADHIKGLMSGEGGGLAGLAKGLKDKLGL